MKIQIDRKHPREIRENTYFQQTAYWSQVKEVQGIGTRAFDLRISADELFPREESREPVTDDILIFLQEIGNGSRIAYIPYGPTIQPAEGTEGRFLEELSESIRPLLPPGCICLRYDLSWESLWAREEGDYLENGDWKGPPEKNSQELRLNFSTRRWNLRKANTDIQPSHTVILDLSRREEELLGDMKQKTRYNIRLSGNRGVKVRKAELEELDIWKELYRQTARRNHLVRNDSRHFRAVLEAKRNHPEFRARVDYLVAEKEGEPLAAMFLITLRNTATYLYGASSGSQRNSMATYALQWEAIRRARERGCREYDLFGIAPIPNPAHPLYGLFRFKTGFGGRILHRMGCWDYPLDRERYDEYTARELGSQGYHLR